MRLCLSPFTSDLYSENQDVLLAGSWCVTKDTIENFKKKNINYTLQKPRTLTKDQFNSEAEYCLEIYNKYIKILSNEFNRIHKKNYSVRYWNILCNRILYSLTASIIDKYHNLKLINENHKDLMANTIDYNFEWFSPHGFPSFGGSRLIHFVLYSIIAENFPIISTQKVKNKLISEQLSRIGDGKKDPRSRSRIKNNLSIKQISNYFKLPFIRPLKGSLPLRMLRYTQASVVSLGDQYLQSNQIKNLLKRVNNPPFYYEGNSKKINYPNPLDKSFRGKISFPDPENIIEKSLQDSICLLFPTYLLENYSYMIKKNKKFIPKKKLVILNSQHCSGRESLDFFIAHSVEEYQSQHIQINHGGCYGIMATSIQEQIWSQISDTYAIWSNPKTDSHNNYITKMPSLRFHNWQYFSTTNKLKNNILYLGSGYYPHRYSYDSIFPLTISNDHEDWQIRFFSNIIRENMRTMVIRDFHGYTDLSFGELGPWILKNQIKKSNKLTPLKEELEKAKLTVHCVPQTTYMETISADIPTICYWNPDDNLIREDLKIFFDELVKVGVVHYSPESAAVKVNEVSNDPSKWWYSKSVRAARKQFQNNVCYTSPDAIDQWSTFINSIKR